LGETYWDRLLGDFLQGPQTSWEFELPVRFSPGTLNFPGPQISREKVKELFVYS
jgi:hypothetical protein